MLPSLPSLHRYNYSSECSSDLTTSSGVNSFKTQLSQLCGHMRDAYLKITLKCIIKRWLLLIEVLYQIMHTNTSNGRLVVGLLCVHQHSDLLCGCSLYNSSLWWTQCTLNTMHINLLLPNHLIFSEGPSVDDALGEIEELVFLLQVMSGCWV